MNRIAPRITGVRAVSRPIPRSGACHGVALTPSIPVDLGPPMRARVPALQAKRLYLNLIVQAVPDKLLNPQCVDAVAVQP